MDTDAPEIQAAWSSRIRHSTFSPGIVTKNSVKFPAPAKINLSLKVVAKRPDGFHEIETLMAPISLADTLDIERTDAPGTAFTCSDATLPVDDNNLVVRAAKLFFERTKISSGVRIHLEKRVPHGAGLGGGSSDAATTLIGLNALFDTKLDTPTLSAMAAELGSDIPFFVYYSAAMCRGRGELVEPIPLHENLPLLLIKPAFGVPTPWAYKCWAGSVELPGVPYAAQSFPWGTLVNDLERPVFEKYIFLATLKTWLLAQPEAIGALMSGSGSTTIALLRDKSMGAALVEKAHAEFGPDLWTCACSTIAHCTAAA
ncbi:MAG: 4-(cytidine 5'-diphospho)-2-C-methyl-D-erythritol kinase [Chthoniobacteraceae bacterium]